MADFKRYSDKGLIKSEFIEHRTLSSKPFYLLSELYVIESAHLLDIDA
jgi:hypothetical protein